MKYIPFYIDDGINDAGLVIQVNVVPYKEGVWRKTPGKRIPDKMVVRYVLDNFADAETAARAVCDNAYYTRYDFNYHWLISDRDSVWLVEDGVATDITSRPYMTNFRCKGTVDDAYVNDPYGMGLERYNLLKNASDMITNPEDALDFMS